MKVRIEIDLKPFTVPNFVVAVKTPGEKQDGFNEGRSFALADLDSETLLELCNDFRDEVFKKAGRELPPQPAVG